MQEPGLRQGVHTLAAVDVMVEQSPAVWRRNIVPRQEAPPE
jgi:hypothetical protein